MLWHRTHQAGEGAWGVFAELAGTTGRGSQRTLINVYAALQRRPAVASSTAVTIAGGFVVADEAVSHHTVLTAAGHVHSLNVVVMDGGEAASQFVTSITAGGCRT